MTTLKKEQKLGNPVLVETGRKSHRTCRCCGREFYQQYFNCPFCNFRNSYGRWKSSFLACYQYEDNYWEKSYGWHIVDEQLDAKEVL